MADNTLFGEKIYRNNFSSVSGEIGVTCTVQFRKFSCYLPGTIRAKEIDQVRVWKLHQVRFLMYV